MQNFIGVRLLGTLMSLSLILQPAHAQLAPMSTGMDAAIPAAEEVVTPTTASSSGDISGTSRPNTRIMGGVSLPKTPMTMDFQEADIRDVLHLLAVKSGLNIIYGTDVTGTISIHLDRVPFDQAFQTVLTLKGLVALPMGARIIRVVTSTALTTEQSSAATFTRVFRLNYALAEDIKKPVDAIRSAAGRKGVSTVDTKTNSLIITDTQEGLKEVEDLIPILDKKPQQVDIEAKIVEVGLDDRTQTGISWQYAGNVGPRDAYQIGGTDEAALVPGRRGVTDPTGIAVPAGAGAADAGSNIMGTGVNLNNISSAGFSFLTSQGTYMLSAQISALSIEGRAKVLSTPHIVTTNNEEARIDVANKIPYQVSTLSNGVSQTSVQFIEAGVKLRVKPTVNADRRITLKVNPEVSNSVGGGLANLPPTVNTRQAETTVVLRDGETIAIGGLIQENVNKGVTGVPLLMDIPIIGYLFKQTDNRKQRTELIVFLTPKIAAE